MRTRFLLRLTAAALTAVITLSGCSADSDLDAAQSPASSQAPAPARQTTHPAPTGQPLRTPQNPGAAKSLATLRTLPVKGRAPATGYSREGSFGRAWIDTDRNGCRTRDDVLSRDLIGIERRGGCTIASGILHDPYTGKRIRFQHGPTTSAQVQIDHIVALQNAWVTGAQQLSQQRRIEFANDPMNLIAVDGKTNAAKGSKDASAWLPPNTSYRCTYVGLQIRMKKKYALWVTGSERQAMERVLRKC